MMKSIVLTAATLGLAGVCSAQTLYNNTANDDNGFPLMG